MTKNNRLPPVEYNTFRSNLQMVKIVIIDKDKNIIKGFEKVILPSPAILQIYIILVLHKHIIIMIVDVLVYY